MRWEDPAPGICLGRRLRAGFWGCSRGESLRLDKWPGHGDSPRAWNEPLSRCCLQDAACQHACTCSGLHCGELVSCCRATLGGTLCGFLVAAVGPGGSVGVKESKQRLVLAPPVNKSTPAYKPGSVCLSQPLVFYQNLLFGSAVSQQGQGSPDSMSLLSAAIIMISFVCEPPCQGISAVVLSRAGKGLRCCLLAS